MSEDRADLPDDLAWLERGLMADHAVPQEPDAETRARILTAVGRELDRQRANCWARGGLVAAAAVVLCLELLGQSGGGGAGRVSPAVLHDTAALSTEELAFVRELREIAPDPVDVEALVRFSRACIDPTVARATLHAGVLQNEAKWRLPRVAGQAR